MKITLTFLSLMSAAQAACPNACSGHGTCGKYDSCSCHTNWEGGDCSLRTCPYYWAYVTTANGDINYDGDRYDTTMYDVDHTFSSSGIGYVVNQQSPGGTWESWPSTFRKGGHDEGHFYMECANRGLCDRKTGTCECFAGYTGSACRRTSCPDDCSGHGTCETVSELAVVAGTTYSLWDASSSRSCKCDPGYSGPNCNSRVCPVGDDPLTTGQQAETQFIDIYSDSEGTHAGTFTLAYKDYYGASWVTDPIDYYPYAGTATGIITKVKDALEGLPDDVIKSVTVTEGYCEQVIEGTVKFATNVLGAGTNAGTGYTVSDGDIVRCPGASTTLPMRYDLGTTSWYLATDVDVSDTAETITDVDDLTCYLVSHAYCNRVAVVFSADEPGDIENLVVDTAEITINSENTFQGATTIGNAVTDTPQLIRTGGSAEYIAPGTDEKVCTADNCDIATSAGVTTVTLDADGDVYGTHERIELLCGSLLLGTFTIHASTWPTATAIVLQEKAPACAGTTGNEVTVSRISDYIYIDADLTGSANVNRITIADWSQSPTGDIEAIYWDATASATGALNGRIFLVNDETTTADNFHTADISASSGVISIDGAGTTESSECSDRGLCDSDSGVCACFKGYTGVACQTQNSLST